MTNVYLLQCVALVASSIFVDGQQVRHSDLAPKTILMDGESLFYLRNHQDEVSDAIDSIISRAHSKLDDDVQTVLDKGYEANAWPNAGIHDYYSFGPYWWKASEAPCLSDLCEDIDSDDKLRHNIVEDMNDDDSLTDSQYERLSNEYDVGQKKCYDSEEYVRCDGEVNDSLDLPNDKHAKDAMVQAVYTGSLAYWYTGEERYAELAAKWARAWFVDGESRMNPNMNFAQSIVNSVPGRPYGILEVQRFMRDVFDALELIRGSEHWTDTDVRGVYQWQKEFLDWLQTDDMAQLEENAYNNHATWFKYMEFYLTIKVGNSVDDFDKVAEMAQDIISKQYDHGSLLPYEALRTRSRHYLVYGTLPLVRCAVMLQKLYLSMEGEVDKEKADYLWNYRSSNTDSSLVDAIHTIYQYAVEGEEYPFPDDDGRWLDFDTPGNYEEIHLLANAYAPQVPSDSYAADLEQVSGFDQEKCEKQPLRLYYTGLDEVRGEDEDPLEKRGLWSHQTPSDMYAKEHEAENGDDETTSDAADEYTEETTTVDEEYENSEETTSVEEYENSEETTSVEEIENEEDATVDEQNVGAVTTTHIVATTHVVETVYHVNTVGYGEESVETAKIAPFVTECSMEEEGLRAGNIWQSTADKYPSTCHNLQKIRKEVMAQSPNSTCKPAYDDLIAFLYAQFHKFLC